MAKRKTSQSKATKAKRTAESSPAAEDSTSLQESAARLLPEIQERAGAFFRLRDAASAQSLAEASGELEQKFRLLREHAETFARASREKAESLALIQADLPGVPAAVPEDAQDSADVADVKGLDFYERADRKEDEGADTGIRLDEFMRQIAEAVVAAQKRLDVQSLAYARQVAGTPIAPAHFSLPSVKAEIKMGLTAKDGSGLVAHLFGSPEERSSYSESTVGFEIVSSPPPPGGSPEWTQPVPEFLIVGEERELVLNRIRDSGDISDDRRLSSAAVLLTPPADHSAATPADHRRYIVLVPGLRRSDEGDVVRVSLDKESFSGKAPAESFFAHLVWDLAAELRLWEESVAVGG
jgi:hypothetical protein